MKCNKMLIRSTANVGTVGVVDVCGFLGKPLVHRISHSNNYDYELWGPSVLARDALWAVEVLWERLGAAKSIFIVVLAILG